MPSPLSCWPSGLACCQSTALTPSYLSRARAVIQWFQGGSRRIFISFVQNGVFPQQPVRSTIVKESSPMRSFAWAVSVHRPCLTVTRSSQEGVHPSNNAPMIRVHTRLKRSNDPIQSTRIRQCLCGNDISLTLDTIVLRPFSTKIVFTLPLAYELGEIRDRTNPSVTSAIIVLGRGRFLLANHTRKTQRHTTRLSKRDFHLVPLQRERAETRSSSEQFYARILLIPSSCGSCDNRGKFPA